MVAIESFIRDIPDFPEKGIVFKRYYSAACQWACPEKGRFGNGRTYREAGIEQVVGIESRGFIFGMGIALSLGCGFMPGSKTW